MNKMQNSGKYLDAVHDGRPSSASPDGSGHDSACGNSSGSVNGTVLYLKDWHFQRLRIKGSGGGGAGGGNGGDGVSSATVETPFFFEDDWLNWWCVSLRRLKEGCYFLVLNGFLLGYSAVKSE